MQMSRLTIATFLLAQAILPWTIPPKSTTVYALFGKTAQYVGIQRAERSAFPPFQRLTEHLQQLYHPNATHKTQENLQHNNKLRAFKQDNIQDIQQIILTHREHEQAMLIEQLLIKTKQPNANTQGKKTTNNLPHNYGRNRPQKHNRVKNNNTNYKNADITAEWDVTLIAKKAVNTEKINKELINAPFKKA